MQIGSSDARTRHAIVQADTLVLGSSNDYDLGPRMQIDASATCNLTTYHKVDHGVGRER